MHEIIMLCPLSGFHGKLKWICTYSLSLIFKQVSWGSIYIIEIPLNTLATSQLSYYVNKALMSCILVAFSIC